MKTDELMSKLFGFSIPTYYNWKKENRPIIKLINKYLSNEEIIEFLEKDKTFNLDFYYQIKDDFQIEYQKFTRNYHLDFTFPTKFYYDFLQRFKNNIIKIDKYEAKSEFISLLLEYQLVLIKIAREIGYSDIRIIKDFNYFINLFNAKNETFIIYLITLVQHDDMEIVHYLMHNSLFEDEIPADKIISYTHKDLITIGIQNIQSINCHHSYSQKQTFSCEEEQQQHDEYRGKDFFETYEDYLLKKEESESDIIPF